MAYIDNIYSVVQIAPNGVETYVRLSQNENGRILHFAIVGGETFPAGCTVTIAGTKPDGNLYSASGTFADSVATFNEDVQMTAVSGTWAAKIEITSAGNVVASGRIRFVIDEDPTVDGVQSDSELEGYVAQMAALADQVRGTAYGSPLTASTAAGMTDQSRVYVYTGDEAGYTAGNWYYYNGSSWVSGGTYNSSAVQTDPTLSVPGMAADAYAAGEAIAAAEGLSDEAKTALLNCLAHVAWTDTQGQTYYDALHDALYDTSWMIANTLTNCTTNNSAASITRGNAYTATLTANVGYTLTGATVSVYMGGADVTSTVYSNGVINIASVTGALVITASAVALSLSSIAAVFDVGEDVILDTYDVGVLKDYLTVTATYSDSSTAVISSNNYTVSGGMTAGTNTYTVSYSDVTDTFTATVLKNYASAISTWSIANGASNFASTTDDVLYFHDLTSTEISNWGVWCANLDATHWDDVVGKTLRFRFKAKRTISGDSASGAVNGYASIFKDAGVTTMSSANRKSSAALFSLGGSNITTEYSSFSADFVCDISNFSGAGSLTPTSSSTFGFLFFAVSVDTFYIKDAEIFEVTS